MGVPETVADHEKRIARLEQAFFTLGDLVVEIKETLRKHGETLGEIARLQKAQTNLLQEHSALLDQLVNQRSTQPAGRP